MEGWLRLINEKRKGILIKLLLIIAIGGMVYSGYGLFNIWYEYKKNDTSYQNVRKYQPEIIPATGTWADTPFKFQFTREEFESLYAINNDLIGWIVIPGTNVNYPMVQGSDSEYYLHHNFEKQVNSGGAIFLDSEQKTPFDDKNTIIYGHHMRDGSMFGSLKNLEEQSFLDNNNKVYIATKDYQYMYQIFSIYVDNPDSDSYYYKFASDDEFISYLKKLKSKSAVNSDVNDFVAGDKIITLSTCSYEFNDARLIVHAKLISQNKY